MKKKTISEKRRISIASVAVMPYLLFHAVISLVLGVVIFAAAALAIHLVAGTGLLDSINSLLGSTMVHFDERKLDLLALLFAVLVIIARTLFKGVYALLANATLKTIGGLPLAVADEEAGFDDGKKSIASAPMTKSAEMKTPRTVESHVTEL